MATTLTREQLEKFWNADALISQQDPALYTHIVADPRYIENFDAYVAAAGLEGDNITALRAQIVAKHEAAITTLDEMEYGYTQRQLFGSSNNLYDLTAAGDFETLGYTTTAEKTIFTGLEAPTPLTAAELQPVPALDPHATIQAAKDAAPISTISDGLKGQVYQGVVMLVGGTTLANTPIPSLDGSQLDAATASFLRTFDANESFAGDDIQSRTQAIAILRKGASGQDLSADEQAIFNSMLAVHGYAEDNNFSFNSTNTEAEQGFAATIADGYEAGKTRVEIISGAEATRVANAEAARAEADRLAAEETARVEAARAEAAEARAATQLTLRRDHSFAALGYNGTLGENTYGFANDFKNSLIRQGYGSDFAGVMTSLEDPEKLQSALSYAIANGDYREQFLAKLEAGDAASISAVQAAIGVEITGEFNTVTRQGMQTYIDQEIGLGDTHFRETYSAAYNAHLVENGLTDSDAVFASFQEDNPDQFRYGLSQNSVMNGIKDGTVPVVMEALPENLQGILSGMPGEAFAHQRAMLVAQHLTEDPANFRAYDAALKARDVSGLSARLDAIVDETITPVVNNAGGIIAGPEAALAAANLGVDLPPDAAAPGDFSQFGNAEFSLAVLSNSVLAYSDTFSFRPGAPTTADGGVVDSTNISFNQLMETEFMGTKWYDQLYGSEYTVGDRTMIDAVVNEGIPIAEAARRAGITDPDAPLNLEDPAVLAKVTNGVFLATRGQTFSEEVAPPFSDKQLQRAAYTALGEDIPEELKDEPTTAPDADPAIVDRSLVSSFAKPAGDHHPPAAEPVKVAGAGFSFPDRAAAMRFDA